jgi:hypothetical protein
MAERIYCNIVNIYHRGNLVRDTTRNETIKMKTNKPGCSEKFKNGNTIVTGHNATLDTERVPRGIS